MSKLEELKKQKREIEQKIKELECTAVVCGCAKLDKEHYPTVKPDEWAIYIKRILDKELKRQPGWYSIIRSQDKEWCINQIQIVVNDLQGLLEKLKGND